MEAPRGRIYLYDYPYSILCFGALQSALAGVALHTFALWSLTESRENFLNAGNDKFKIWGVLVWFLIDFLMGIFLLVCTLCHLKSVFFKIWVLVNWITNIFLDYYCFSCFDLFTNSQFLNIYGWILVTYTCIRFCSTLAVWNYSRLREIRGPTVYLPTDSGCNSDSDNFLTNWVFETGIGKNKLKGYASSFVVDQRFAIMRE